ncbi:MAG: AMP-binding protein [Acidobacteriota bacterium]|nr:AMP-binding protein [Acidobacteriota bacterium]
MDRARADLEYANTAAVIRARSREVPAAVAIDDSSWTLTYGELHDEVSRTARAIHAAGIGRGDRVGIWAPNSTAWVVAAVGIHAAGGILVPVNTRFKGEEAAYVLRRSGARGLFVVPDFLGTSYTDAMSQADPELYASLLKVSMPGADAAPGVTPWKDFHAGVPAEAPDVEPHPVADIIFTSGTTGHPKGVVLGHAQTLRAYEAFNEGFGLRADDRYLITNPFFHCFGYKAGWLLCMLMGATALPHAVFDVEKVLRRIEKERVTVVAGPPTMFTSILDFQGPLGDISSLRFAFTAAASIPVTLVERMQSVLDVEVGTGYGLTESTAIVSVTRPGDDAATIAHTVGSPVVDIEVRIVGSEHQTLGVGESGEIAVRGYNVMSGYWEDPVATAEVVDEQGWLYTGDVGSIDAKGNITITDRIKDIVIVGGFNVSPKEVESILLSDTRIAQVVVVGMPDDRLGEVPAAFVVPRPGVTVTPAEVIGTARARMANYKVPRHVEIVDGFPVNAAGKIVKADLRRRAARAASLAGETTVA